VQLQNSNLEFGIPPISYASSYFKQKQHVNGQHPAEQACKIWRKNFQALLSNHILGVGSFFKPHPVYLCCASILYSLISWNCDSGHI